MGEIENRPPDPSLLRISDNDRQKVADVLRDAAGEGRIDLEELDERLELTWGAKTYADLVPITADLHLPRTAARAHRSHGPDVPVVGHASSTAIMGECKRQGVWSVPEHHSAFALMGRSSSTCGRPSFRRPTPRSTPARSWARSRSSSRPTSTS